MILLEQQAGHDDPLEQLAGHDDSLEQLPGHDNASRSADWT